MDLLRVDLVSVCDLRFERARKLPWPLLQKSDSLIASRLNESFGWNFYGEQLQGFDSYDLSQVVPDSIGAALRINCQSCVGSLLVWHTADGRTDPLEFKKGPWQEGYQDLPFLEPLFRGLHGDRVYPFMSIQANTDANDLDVFATSNAEELGRLLTSDLARERISILKKYIESDLSIRAYEKLFLRWTDALAVYARLEPELYENSMFRAVQIFEHCILGEVSLVSCVERMDRFSRRLALVTPRKWLRARELFVSLADTESIFFVYPRTQSVEANQLLTAAHKQFGLGEFLTSAKAKGAEARSQFEWAKTQTLGTIALLTYLLDKVIGWKIMKSWLWTLFQ